MDGGDAGTVPPAKGTLILATGGHGAGSIRIGAGLTGECTSARSLQVDPGIQIQLTAEPAARSRFVAWHGCGLSDGVTCSLVTAAGVANVTAAFEPLPVTAGTCDELAPARAPSAPTVFSVPVLHPGDDSCEPGTSDGAGVVLVHLNRDLQPGGSHAWTVAPDASSSTEFFKDTFVLDLIGQRNGFEGGTWIENISSIALFDEHGHAQADILLNGPGGGPNVPLPRTMADPGGGILVANVDDTAVALNIQSYSPAATLKWSFALPVNAVVAGLGTDTAGFTLVVWQLVSDRPAGPLTGQWIDPAGNAAPPFAFDSGAVSYALYPRVVGGFFVERFTALPTGANVTDWRGEIDSSSAQIKPVPGWLARQTAVAVRLIHGNRGYAVTPLAAGTVSPCTQSLSVVSASGDLCASFAFPIASNSCTPAPLTIGVDGTVIAQLPTPLEKTDQAGRPATCTWEWWSGFLR